MKPIPSLMNLTILFLGVHLIGCSSDTRQEDCREIAERLRLECGESISDWAYGDTACFQNILFEASDINEATEALLKRDTHFCATNPEINDDDIKCLMNTPCGSRLVREACDLPVQFSEVQEFTSLECYNTKCWELRYCTPCDNLSGDECIDCSASCELVNEVCKRKCLEVAQ